MIIYNTDTQTEEEIRYICNYQDMSELALESGQIKYNKEEGRYEASDEEIRWWEDWFEQAMIADDMENDLKEIVSDYAKMGYEYSFEWIPDEIDYLNQDAGWSEFSEVPRERQRLYRELYRKIQEWWNNKDNDCPVEGYHRLE